MSITSRQQLERAAATGGEATRNSSSSHNNHRKRQLPNSSYNHNTDTNNNNGNTMTSTSLYHVTSRQRSFTVLFLSGLSMVVCFLWWGSLPAGTSTGLFVNSGLNGMNAKQQSGESSLDFDSFSDDDENEFTGDDDTFKFGERPRDKDGKRAKGQTGKEKNDNNNSKKPTKKPSSSKSSTTAGVKSLTSSPETDISSESTKRPKLVWLASYPNSGTSYTMTMVGRASGSVTATNYGRELMADSPTRNTPVYPNQWDGPFYRPSPERDLPEEYIMVKTHCGGRCVSCGPEEYLMNETAFLDECRRGSGLLPEAQQKSALFENNQVLENGMTVVHYDASLVKRAIHLIRNPFHNIVSRFHLERKHWKVHNKSFEVERYTNDPIGFHAWCADLNKNYGPTLDPNSLPINSIISKEAHMSIPHDVIELMQDVPCHGEIYKYVQWHNNANIVMTQVLKKPTKIVHYENYDTKWNKTVTGILDFLHLDYVGDKKPFTARHDYDPYFSQSQQKAAKKLIKRLAVPYVWEQLERYFPTNRH